MKKPLLKDTHGTRRCYIETGCRCQLCKTANTEYQHSYREKCRELHKIVPALTPHGTTAGYDDYGCRCEPCGLVKSEKARKSRGG